MLSPSNLKGVTMSSDCLTQEQIAGFQRDGDLMVEGLFDAEEMGLLLETAKTDSAVEKNSIGLDDGSGGISRLTLWYTQEDNLYGMFTRCHRVVEIAQQLLGAPICHYHSKMMLKEPRTGGAWAWHQDYGYWYDEGFLFPDMLSCLIAVDHASRENGCLQVIKGSHRMANVKHGLTGQQSGADIERVEQALQVLPLVYCEMKPGTALFFHSNLLHASAQNTSENPRWSLISCYTAEHNLPFKRPSHPAPQRVNVVPDSAIKATGAKGFTTATFLAPIC